jgi:hypothetical protein
MSLGPAGRKAILSTFSMTLDYSVTGLGRLRMPASLSREDFTSTPPSSSHSRATSGSALKMLLVPR